MKLKEFYNARKSLVRLFAIAAIIGFAVLFGSRLSVSESDVSPTAHAQTDFALQRRVDMIEQRFYMLESRLNSVETQSRYPSSSSSPTGSLRTESDLSLMRTQMEVLRAQVDLLNKRLSEVECGLLRVDERTLTQAARDMRRRGREDENEPCRLNPNTAVRLTAR